MNILFLALFFMNLYPLFDFFVFNGEKYKKNEWFINYGYDDKLYKFLNWDDIVLS